MTSAIDHLETSKAKNFTMRLVRSHHRHLRLAHRHERLKHLQHGFASVIKRLIAKVDGGAHEGRAHVRDANLHFDHRAEHATDQHRDAKQHQHGHCGS
jgi:hypothetical protein